MIATEPPDPASPCLHREACLFACYLIGRRPPRELQGRYARAIRRLAPRPTGPADAVVLAFARQHPWSLPLLDAALALVRGDALLRRRIFVMAAVMEASPRYAVRFLPEDQGLVRLVARLAGWGLMAGIRAALGLPLLKWVEARVRG